MFNWYKNAANMNSASVSATEAGSCCSYAADKVEIIMNAIIMAFIFIFSLISLYSKLILISI